MAVTASDTSSISESATVATAVSAADNAAVVEDQTAVQTVVQTASDSDSATVTESATVELIREHRGTKPGHVGRYVEISTAEARFEPKPRHGTSRIHVPVPRVIAYGIVTPPAISGTCSNLRGPTPGIWARGVVTLRPIVGTARLRAPVPRITAIGTLEFTGHAIVVAIPGPFARAQARVERPAWMDYEDDRLLGLLV